MCFSAEVSVITFMISWMISLYLLHKGITPKQRQHIIFLMIFSSIQIADALLWHSKMKKNKINYLATSFLIPFILSLQVCYNVFVVNKSDNKLVNIGVVVGCIYMFYRFNGYSKSICDNKLSSPIWGSNEIKLWELILFAIGSLYPFTWTALLLPVIFVVYGGGYGSLWCAIANVVSLYYLYSY